MKTIVVNLRSDKFDIYIGRGSKWGNPFHMRRQSIEERDRVIRLYREHLLNNKDLLDSLHELKGKRLGCYCKPFPCHGDVLVEEINKL